MNYDIVIPYRENASLELQYAIRGIMKNFPHNKIHIVGDGITGTDHVKRNLVNRPSPYMNVQSKVIQACEELVETDYFWLFNDDFFCLEQVIEPFTYHRGLLSGHIAIRRYRDSYSMALANTLQYLKSYGIDEPLSYELHLPMLFNTQRYIEVFNEAKPTWRRKDLLTRTVYGNIEKVGGLPRPDVKNPLTYQGADFISTNDKTFADDLVGEYIRSELS